MIRYLYVVAVTYGQRPHDSAVHFRHRRIMAKDKKAAETKGRAWAERTRDAANKETIENDHVVRLGFA